jgi:hypothetical protein
MVRVRFHLGAGEHCNHWQVRHEDGRVEYFDPATSGLRMIGCRLRNHRGTAQRIHDGEHKSPCAWVEAQWVYRYTPTADDMPCGDWVGYNPRVSPNWRSGDGGNLDGREFSVITTEGRALWAQ